MFLIFVTNSESSDAFDMYFKTKFECMHTEENSINNHYNQVSNCDSVEIDYQSYDDVCEYYISKVYTMYSCQCLALARMSEMLSSEAKLLLQSWFDSQLETLLTDELKMYGCAIDLQCDIDRDIEDVLFEIERRAYFVNFDIFVSHDDITNAVPFSSYIIDGLSELLNDSNSSEEQIYIKDQTLVSGSVPGVRSSITVVFDSEDFANDFIEAMNGYNSTFPFKDDEHTLLIVDAQLSSDDTIDNTEYYFGSHRVYPLDDRTEKDALIAGVVLTAAICVVCCLLAYWYRCRPGIEYK